MILEYTNKFIRFFISVIIGFFLTTIYPIFKLLNNKKTKIIIIFLLIITVSFFYTIIKLMLGYTE
uniref:Uncharacterized protein ycf33 n=1 Tax=Lympha mucosa TaxID=2045360 RepID=A0A6B9VQ69_9FLOR|nr:hypothetical protein [Lympha mucosa]